jgi:hypothetical protein
MTGWTFARRYNTIWVNENEQWLHFGQSNQQ